MQKTQNSRRMIWKGARIAENGSCIYMIIREETLHDRHCHLSPGTLCRCPRCAPTRRTPRPPPRPRRCSWRACRLQRGAAPAAAARSRGRPGPGCAASWGGPGTGPPHCTRTRYLHTDPVTPLLPSSVSRYLCDVSTFSLFRLTDRSNVNFKYKKGFVLFHTSYTNVCMC